MQKAITVLHRVKRERKKKLKSVGRDVIPISMKGALMLPGGAFVDMPFENLIDALKKLKKARKKSICNKKKPKKKSRP